MENLELYYKILVGIQLLHSIEEIATGFHKRWPLWKMSRTIFVVFELCFSALIITVVAAKAFPYRDLLMISFNVLMFANGIWHLMWAGIEKKYVPGLITAPIFILVFLAFYFTLF